jgi:hypothetical protein
VSGDWTDPTKWSTNPAYPNNSEETTYSAVVAASGAPYSVAIGATAITVDSILVNPSDATIVQSNGGAITAQQITLDAGTWRFNPTDPSAGAGTISNAVLRSDFGSKFYVDAGTLTLDSVTINAPIEVASGATLRMQGNWSTAFIPPSDTARGIRGTNTNIVLDGTFNIDDLLAIRTGGSTTISISGSAQNGGLTSTTISATRGYWRIEPSAIVNGKISTQDGTLHVYGGEFTGGGLHNADLEPGATVVETSSGFEGGAIRLLGGTSASSLTSLMIGGGTGKLQGSGILSFDGDTSFSRLALKEITSFQTVRTGTQGGTIVFAMPGINRGTISAETAGKTLTIDGIFDNGASAFGGVFARNGSTLSVLTGGHLGTISLSTGTWSVMGSSTITFSDGSQVSKVGATARVTLDGPNASFAALSGVQTNGGQIALLNGNHFVFEASTLTNSNSTSRITIGAGSQARVKGQLINNGKIDVSGQLIVEYPDGDPSPIDTFLPQLISGYNNGAWNGIGINSTVAANSGGTRRVGYLDDSDASEILFETVYGGDSNLDGVVDAVDLSALAANWGSNGYWEDGDFTYDNLVNVADLKILANNWQSGTAAPTVSLDALLISFGLPLVEVPEPTTAGIIAGTVGWAALSRRRFKKGERRA